MTNELELFDNKSRLTFNSCMIKRFQPKDDKFSATASLIRYHYTSASALMKILKSDNETPCIRFTDVRYLNDKSEMIFFVKRLLEFLNDNKTNYPFCYEIVNELLLKQHTENEYIELKVPKIEFTEPENTPFGRIRNFVFCSCKDADSLSMWNYYLQNGEYQGYNIGINLYKFLKSFDVEKGYALDPILFYYGEVIYSKEKQFKEIKAICDTIEEKGYRSKNNNFIYTNAMYKLYMYICSCGMFFKDESFAHENEYRILIEISESRLNQDKTNYANKYNKKIQYSFYERKGILVPCLEVPFERDSIKTITIAPIMEQGVALAGINDFLLVNGYNNISVNSSKIPIRY